jgi:ribonuclease HI
MLRTGEAKSRKKAIVVAFLDMSKAYDNVVPDVLVSMMNDLDFHPQIVRWIAEYLSNREVILNTPKGQIKRETTAGIPQGCPLSPTLFNIYTRELARFNDDETTVLQYADDAAVMCCARTIEEAENRMERKLQEIADYFRALQLTVNPEKSAVMYLTHFKKGRQLKMNNKEIPRVKKYKYLGVVIDERLGFRHHVEHLRSVANDKLNALRIFGAKSVGAHPTTLMKVSTAVIRTTLDYGASVYGDTTKEAWRRVNTALYNTIRGSCRYLRTTPRLVMLSENGMLPQDLRAEWMTAKEAAKLLHENKRTGRELRRSVNNARGGREPYIVKVMKEHGDVLMDIGPAVRDEEDGAMSDEWAPLVRETIPGIRKDETNPAIMRALTRERVETDYADFELLFTDGSKMENGTGYGVYDPREDKTTSVRLKEGFTIMNAELAALNEAVSMAIGRQGDKFAILTDSRTALQTISNDNRRNYLAQEIRRKLRKTNKTIALQWIPSHVGIPGNERADEAAREAMALDMASEAPLTLDDALLQIRKRVWDKWKRHYVAESRNSRNEYYVANTVPRRRPWYEGHALSATDVITVSRIRSGHVATKNTLRKWGLVDDDQCQHCRVEEDLEHIMYECPLHEESRRRNLRDGHYKEWLWDACTEDLRGLAKFIKETGVNV